MKVYLFMGSHLREIRSCMQYLADAEEPSPVRLHVPLGLDWPVPEDNSATLETYDPGAVLWVLDPDAGETVFILLDPRLSPVLQLEKLADDLGKCLLQPVKVITCVDCAAAEQNPRLRSWLEVCIYYSDIVLLGNRNAASKAFVRDYQKGFERRCYPCLFGFLKAEGYPDNPLQILAPDTRRLTQLFDLQEALPETLPGMVIEASCDLDLEEQENDPYRTPAEHDCPPRSIPDISPWIVR